MDNWWVLCLKILKMRTLNLPAVRQKAYNAWAGMRKMHKMLPVATRLHMFRAADRARI